MQGFERCVVLVADDEPVVLNLVRAALVRHGYVVIPAEDGPSAPEPLREPNRTDSPGVTRCHDAGYVGS
jgi:CheY-like chemotaxis protein